MKIKLTNDVRGSLDTQKFFKGKVYNAEPASNQPGYCRLGKKAGLIVNKIFVTKGKNRPDIDTLLLDKNDFVILDFPEKEEIISKYKASKIKIPKVKKICPDGFVLRENFRLITEKEFDKHKDFHYCATGTKDGPCNKPAKFIRPLRKNLSIVTVCCGKHAMIPG